MGLDARPEWDWKAAHKLSIAKRRARAELRKQVKSGEVPVSDVIEDYPDFLRTSVNARPITLADILSWQPHWGTHRAERFLRRQGIPPGLELHALSASRRKFLADRLH